MAGLGLWLGNTVAWPAKKGGPEGPLWFDVLVIVLATTPLLLRRRYPFGCLVAVGILIAGGSFVDGRLASPFVAFLVGLTISVLFGMRPDKRHSVGGPAYHSGQHTCMRPLCHGAHEPEERRVVVIEGRWHFGPHDQVRMKSG